MPAGRDFTCLDVFFETQPMPNPLSWYMHQLPRSVLHGGVWVNHFVELIVPFAYFLPQPFASVAGIVTILFQLMLIAGGNLSWLNWLTVVLAFTTIDDRLLSWLPVTLPTRQPIPRFQQIATGGLAIMVVLLSIAPVMNMLSPGQVMNTSFNPLQIVNMYGAFGSVSKERNEIILEGTDADNPTEATAWRAYEFQGEAGRPHTDGAADRPVSPAHRLADVVCGDVVAVRLPMVPGASAEAASRRCGGGEPAPIEPLPRPSACVDPGRALSLPVHHT